MMHWRYRILKTSGSDIGTSFDIAFGIKTNLWFGGKGVKSPTIHGHDLEKMY